MTTGRREIKRIQQIYAALIAAFALVFVPLSLIQIISGLVFAVVFATLYLLRKISSHESLSDNHATYLIRTIWIGGTMMALGTVLSAIYLVSFLEPQDYIELSALSVFEISRIDIHTIYEDRYAGRIMTARLLSLAPASLYLAYRFAKGGARAVKGYRVANPLGWF